MTNTTYIPGVVLLCVIFLFNIAGDAVYWWQAQAVRQGTAPWAFSGWLLKSPVPVLGTEVEGNQCGAGVGAGGGTSNPPARAGAGGWCGAGPPGCFQCCSAAVGLMHTIWAAGGYVTKRVPFRKLVC